MNENQPANAELKKLIDALQSDALAKDAAWRKRDAELEARIAKMQRQIEQLESRLKHFSERV